jgi:hypothetical protein
VQADDAQPVIVNGGQERLDVNFTLATVPTHVVSGMLVDPAKASFDQTQVSLVGEEGNGSAPSQRVPVSGKGRFEFRGVVPGRYVLLVGDGPATIRWIGASRSIAVDSDVFDLTIVARPGTTIEGQVTRDHGGSLPFDPRTMHLSVQQQMANGPIVRDENGAGHWTSGWGGQIQADGTFSVETPGGESSLQVAGLPAHWMVKTIRMEGIDIADRLIDFGTGSRRQVEIVLTDRITNVIGTVSDRNGRISDYTVVVFPDDLDRRTPSSRLVRGVRPLQDGTFRIDALPAGDYLAIAVKSLPQGAWTDPHVLDRLYPLTTRVRLAEGEQHTLALKISPTPEGLVGRLRS